MDTRLIRIELDDSEPPAYLGIDVSELKGSVARFETGDPVADWQALGEFCRAEPKVYMNSSSLDEFGWYVPGYRFEMVDGVETIVLDPADVYAGEAPADLATSRTVRFVYLDFDAEAEPPAYLGVVVRTRDGEIASFRSGEVRTDWSAFDTFVADNPGQYLTTRSLADIEYASPRSRAIQDETGRATLAFDIAEPRPDF